MSNDIKVIKELSKLTGREFKEFDSKFLDNNRDNSDNRYAIEGENIVYIGLDLMKLNLADKLLKDIENSMSKLKNLRGLGTFNYILIENHQKGYNIWNLNLLKCYR